jgi:hypothetical protein
MNLNLVSLITADYWIGQPPSFKTQTLIIYLLVLGLLFLIGIVCKVIAGKKELSGFRRGMFRRWGTWAIVGALAGGVFVFFRYEYIIFLSRRIWFGLWFVGMVVWAFHVWSVSHKRVARVQKVESIAEDPYLPKRKK